MADIKETVLIDIDVRSDQDDIAKLEKLKSGITLLQKEQQDLTKAYKAGNITLKEFSEGSVRVSNNLKIQQSQFSNLQKSVTGVQSPFDKLNASINGQSALLDKLIPGLGSATTALQTTATGAKSLWVSLGPIAIILGIIAGVLALVTNFLKSTGEGEDQLAKASAVLSALLSNLSDLLNSIVRSLIEFSQTAVGGAILAAAKLFIAFNPIVIQFRIMGDLLDRLVPSFRKAAEAAAALADELDSIEDAERQYNIQAAETENLIKNLIIQSKNRGLSEDERQKKLQQALDLEIKLNETAIEIANRRLQYEVNSIETANLSLKLAQQNNETLEEYALRLSNNNQLTDANKNKVADALKNISKVRGDSLNLREKISNQEEKLDIARIASEEKKAKEIQSIKDKAEKEEDERNKRINDAEFDQAVKAEKEEVRLRDQKAENDKIDSDNFNARWDEKVEKVRIANAQIDEEAQKSFDLVIATEKAKRDAYAATGGAIGALAGLYRKNSLEFKILASAQVIINTALGVSAALSAQAVPFIEPFATITRIASAVAIGLNGAHALADINGVQFYEGGYTGQGNPHGESEKLGKRWYTYHNDEYIAPSKVINTKQGAYHVNELEKLRTGSMIGGGSFFTGGFAPELPSNPVSVDSAGIIRAIKQIQVAVIIEEVEAKIQQRAQIRETANI